MKARENPLDAPLTGRAELHDTDALADAPSLREDGEFTDCIELIDRVRRQSPGCIADLANDYSTASMWLDIDEDRPARIGRFQIRRRLGGGGYGLVFLALDPELEREVALKVPRVEALVTESTRDRFLREAKAVAALNHPNIATIYESGRIGPICYIAAAHYSGGSLAEWIEHHAPCGPHCAAQLLRSLAEAVQHAHSRGILHRDLKPGNVLLDAGRVSKPPEMDGEAGECGRLESRPTTDLAAALRITDFGLAKLAGDSSHQTHTGAVLGTPAYMSPEQADSRADQISTATDVYALGAILYELLTGQPPFQRETVLATLQAVRAEEPTPPRRLRADVPNDLEAICLNCLEKNPDARYASANALAEDLDRFLSGQPVRARQVSSRERIWRWCRRNPFVSSLAAAVVLLCLVLTAGSSVAAVWLAESRRGALDNLQDAIEAREELAEQEQLVTRALFDARIAQAKAARRSGLSGQRLESFAAIRKAASLIPKLGLGEPDKLPLRNEAIAAMALVDLRVDKKWHGLPPRDSHRWIGFDPQIERYARGEADGAVVVRSVVTNEELFRLPGLGEPVSGVNRPYTQFSPDGRFLAVCGEGQDSAMRLQIWDLSHSNTLVLDQRIGGQTGERNVDFGPDSCQLAFLDTNNLIRVQELPSGKSKYRIELASQPQWLRIGPTGKRLAVAQNDGDSARVQVIDMSTGQVEADLPHEHRTRFGAWNTGGDYLATASSDGNAYIWHVASAELRATCGGHRNALRRVSFSHDGDLLMTSGLDMTTSLWDPSSGRLLLRIDEIGTQFSRDDKWLGCALGGVAIGRCEVAASHEFFALAGHSGYVYDVQFSPDGRLLASAAHSDGVRLWDVDAKQVVAHLDLYASSVAFSPDGAALFVGGSFSGIQKWPLGVDRERGVLRVGPPQLLQSSSMGPANMALSQDGRTVSLNKTDRETSVFEVGNGFAARGNVTHDGVRFHSLSPQGELLATGSWHGSGVKVWNTLTGKLVKELPVEGTARVTFSSDGKWLTTCAYDEIAMWEVESWRRVYGIQHAGFNYSSATFDQDGGRMAVSVAGHIKLIDSASGRELARLAAPDQFSAKSVALSPDGCCLATGTTSGVIHIWRLDRVRERLSELGLDWDGPGTRSRPSAELALRAEVDYGKVTPYSKQQQLATRSQATLDDQTRKVETLNLQIEQDPTNAVSHRDRGYALILLHRYENAVEDLSRAIELQENFQSAVYWRGLARMRLADTERAIADFEASLSLQPVDSWCCRHLAFLFSCGPEKLRDSERALALAQQGLTFARQERSKSVSTFLDTLGLAQMRAGQYEKALELLDEAVDKRGQPPPVLHLLVRAICLHDLGQPDDAETCYRDAVQLLAQPILDRDYLQRLCAETAELLQTEE